jgi:hypothetical protein
MIQVVHPGSGSQIQEVKKAPDPGSGSATLLFVLDLYPDPWIHESKDKIVFVFRTLSDFGCVIYIRKF